MNETLSCIAKRFSCRSFTDVMPSDAQLSEIARAAVCSPSGMNRQPWRVIVLKNKELIAELEADGMKAISGWEDKSTYDRIMSRGGTLFYHAPCMIVVPIEPGTNLDCGIVSENIAIAAQSLGLGSLICGMAGIPFSGEKGAEYKKKLGFPEGYEFGIAVLLGYPEKINAPHEPDMGKISYIV